MLKEMQRSANTVHEQANGSAVYIDHSIYDTLIYNAMMHAQACAAGSGHASCEDGWSVYHRMQQAGVRPNLGTYNRLLQVVEGASRHGNAGLADVEKVMTEMQRAGVSPDQESFGIMVELVAAGSLYGTAHLSDAYWILQQMNNAGLQEDLPILKTILLVVIGDARNGLVRPEETEK